MKKIAIALVIVACLLTGALLPALAETDLSRPTAAEEPRMEEKTPGETELPAREENPEGNRRTRGPGGFRNGTRGPPGRRWHPKQPTGARTRRLPKRKPAAPKATRAPKATDGREDPATPEEKPDAFEAPEPSQRHGHHGAAHPHGKRPSRRGEASGPVRAQTCRAVPEQTSGHGRRPRIAAGGAGPERSRPHCAGCPFGRECPGWEKRPARRNAAGPRFPSRNPARQRNPQRRRRFGWDPEWPSESQSGGKNAPPFFCPCYRIVNLL